MSFRSLNNIGGWLVFAISTTVYILTLEPTASFWDCGEFIASAFKLQVPHPPGAPFFLLVGRLFSLLAGNDLTQVAYWVNVSSAIFSGLTILFLFWTISLLAIKMYPQATPDNLTPYQTYTILASAFIGALAYTFTDSFWFSAVEAEVYAMSSFFTALVVWATFKWDLIDDEVQSNRWLIFIAYATGLSIGVHLLNLVTMPALGLLYYYKKYKNPNIYGAIVAMMGSLVIIVIVMYGVITGLPVIAGNFEIFFINSIGLPFGTGISVFIILFLGALVAGIYYSHAKNKVLLNTGLLAFAFVLIGYASYGVILVRAQYNPPINENNPNDIMRVVYYLKREQYGDRPLLFGTTFASKLVDQEKGTAYYRKNDKKGKYEIFDYKTTNKYDNNIFFPRIHSRAPGHAQLYREILQLSPDETPTMGDNLKFFFQHQLGHMYWRYFGWNFIGRESDEEGAGTLSPFASNDFIPSEIANNKGRNQLYALPLIIGLLGFFYQMFRNRNMFYVTFMIFFMTGIALIVYLNSPPVEPRERDYIYAGSFYGFAIWIGLGIMALAQLFTFERNAIIALITAITPDNKKTELTTIKNSSALRGIIGSLIVGIGVVSIMAVEGWDDHNRSNRYHSIDFARNLLNSCAPNAILFTGGDNDTFPLWYIQEVEGVRRDVRVCNLSLLGTDWYIEQMKRDTYESKALPISLVYDNFIQGTNEQIPYLQQHPNFNPSDIKLLQEKGMNLYEYFQLLKNNESVLSVDFGNFKLNTLPSKRLVIELDKKAIAKQNFVPKGLDSLMQDAIIWDLNMDELYKSDLLVLDIIATNAKNGWQRPIYFATNLSNANYMGLLEYMQQEGIAYRLMPVPIKGAKTGYVNSDLMYENLMKKFLYRELNNPNVYYSDTYRSFPMNLRKAFYKLAAQLLSEGKKDKAKEVVLKCFEILPDNPNLYDVYTPPLIDVLLQVGEVKKAEEVANTMTRRADENLAYLFEIGSNDEYKIQSNFTIIAQVASIMVENKNPNAPKYEAIYQKYVNRIER
ncbi:MAG: DUF2723 domain-containing protein [Cytophagales bacterium]|nr:MAG: DUF2723 domain-containing protein [Cytophagales bacterium]